MNIELNSLVVRSPDHVWAEVGDEFVMFDYEAGKYFGVNAVGAAVWKRIEQPTLVSNLCADLEKVFVVSPEQCANSVLRFLRALQRQGLVTVVQ